MEIDMKNGNLKMMILVLAALVAASHVKAQTTRDPNPAIEAQIHKTLLDYYAASDSRDEAGMTKIYAEKSVFYDAQNGLLTGDQLKNLIHPYFLETAAGRVRFTTSIEGLHVLVIDQNSAIANYTMVSSTLKNGKSTIDRNYVTDVMTLRNGRWQIVAEHSSDIPKPVEPIVSGLPNDWIRSPGANGDQYLITVDNTIMHSGKASASIKFACGDSGDKWASLSQAVAADAYRGKRVRLTGWLRTADVGSAGIWMRVDGERKMLGFDNMADRDVTGTTEWKQYSVVLDVPAEAVNIVFGTLIQEMGQVWADDFALAIVDPSVKPTGIIGEGGETDDPSYAGRKRSDRKMPVNLGFEEGAVK